jgi:hypothetical protein
MNQDRHDLARKKMKSAADNVDHAHRLLKLACGELAALTRCDDDGPLPIRGISEWKRVCTLESALKHLHEDLVLALDDRTLDVDGFYKAND